MPPGTQARTICEMQNIPLGAIVTVLQYSASHGYLIRDNSLMTEAWVPPNVLSNCNRKPWSFKFRKGSLSQAKRLGESETPLIEVSCPEFEEKIKDVGVQCGAKVVFKCKVKKCGGSTKISWRKTEPDPCVMRNSGRFVVNQTEDGTAILMINNARISDSGTYLCTVSNEIGSNQCSAVLLVSDTLPLNEPKIQVLSSSSIHLEWENNMSSQFLVEYCRLGTGEWISPNNHFPINASTYTIEHLVPGETYSFRIVNAQNRRVSLPSVAVTLPVADNLRWQQEQFKRRYIELQEIDRGDFQQCV